jgi:hypothetical protein
MNADALIIAVNVAQLAALALRHTIPAISTTLVFVGAVGWMS